MGINIIDEYDDLDEFEFIPYDGVIPEYLTPYYIETSIGRIYIHTNNIFYFKDKNTISRPVSDDGVIVDRVWVKKTDIKNWLAQKEKDILQVMAMGQTYLCGYLSLSHFWRLYQNKYNLSNKGRMHDERTTS